MVISNFSYFCFSVWHGNTSYPHVFLKIFPSTLFQFLSPLLTVSISPHSEFFLHLQGKIWLTQQISSYQAIIHCSWFSFLVFNWLQTGFMPKYKMGLSIQARPKDKTVYLKGNLNSVGIWRLSQPSILLKQDFEKSKTFKKQNKKIKGSII